MIINTNLAALNTVRQLGINEKATSDSLAKLSSGLRINQAADDAAGLSISEKMRGQISGLNQATSNAQDGVSLVSTAEGALNETTAVLQRMRELAVQAGNDTNTTADRTAMQSETNALVSAINDISTNTQFNTKNLLDGTLGKQVTTAVANVSTGVALQNGAGSSAIAGTTMTALADLNGNSLNLVSGDTVSVSFVVNGTTTTNSMTIVTGTTIANVAALVTSGATTIVGGGMVVSADTAGTAGAINAITIQVQDANGNTLSNASNTLSNIQETTAARDTKATDGSLTLQIGANSGQNMNIAINNMGAQALGVQGLQITTEAQANIAIKVIDAATAKVSAQRSALGAFQNRLEHTSNNLGTASQNITSAEAQIRDVDMASEMTNFQKNNVLQQAAQAMLAQANQQPQGVLQLLR
jgi:flagellin